MNDLPPVDSSHRTSIHPYQYTGVQVQEPSYQGNILTLILCFQTDAHITGIGPNNYATISFVPIS